MGVGGVNGAFVRLPGSCTSVDSRGDCCTAPNWVSEGSTRSVASACPSFPSSEVCVCASVRVHVLGQQELCLQLFKVHIMDSKSVAVNLQPLVPRKSRLAEVKVSQGRCWCWTHTHAHVHQPAEPVPSASAGTQS